MSVVSELYKRALHGDTEALAELVANKDKEELYKSVVNDGKRAIEIITVPRYEAVRKALLKMQQVGIYANLDTLGGEAKQIVFSTTTGIDMEDVEKLFISYIEEAERAEKKTKEKEEEPDRSTEEGFFQQAKAFFNNYSGPKRDQTEERARTKAMQDSYESSGFIKGLITGAATVVGIVGGIYLYKKFSSSYEKDDTDIVIISGE